MLDANKGDEGPCFVPDEACKASLWQNSAGRTVIVFKRLAGDVEIDWTEYQSRHREARIQLPVASLDVKVELHLYVFALARGAGERLYVDFLKLYSKLKLTTFKGRPSKWVHDCNDSWMRRLRSHFSSAVFVPGTGAKTTKDTFDKRCLPAPSYSLTATMFLLCLWSAAGKEDGGMEGSPEARKACGDLLDGFVDLACGCLADDDGVVLDVSGKWACKWPRPLEAATPRARLGVSGGAIDLEPLKGIIDTSVVVAEWWNLAFLDRFESTTVPLGRFLACLSVGKRQLVPLLAQMCHFVASLVERKALAMATTDDGEGDFAWLGEGTVAARRGDVDRLCWQYAESCQQLDPRGFQYLSVGTDEGDGGGLPLLQTVLCVGQSTLAVCVPQVGGWGGCLSDFFATKKCPRAGVLYKKTVGFKTI